MPRRKLTTMKKARSQDEEFEQLLRRAAKLRATKEPKAAKKQSAA